MSSISRWYLDAQHSFSFKRYTKFRALHYNQLKGALPSFIMYFYWKISYFGNCLDTAPGQPGGPRLYQGCRAPLAPRWLRPWWVLSTRFKLGPFKHTFKTCFKHMFKTGIPAARNGQAGKAPDSKVTIPSSI